MFLGLIPHLFFMFHDFILINAKYDLKKLALFSIFHFKQNSLIKSNNQIKLSLVFFSYNCTLSYCRFQNRCPKSPY
jgi:hypothetical protein